MYKAKFRKQFVTIEYTTADGISHWQKFAFTDNKPSIFTDENTEVELKDLTINTSIDWPKLDHGF